jgi:hypothetical protein
MKHQFNHPKHYLLPLIVWLLAGFNHAALADLPLVVVKTWGQHVGDKIIYYHQVTNNGIRDVEGIAIGLDTDNQGNDQPFAREQGELYFVTPLGSEMCTPEINPAYISGPAGWTAQIIRIEHAGCFLQWYSPPSPQTPLLPGQTLRFSVTVPKVVDDAYLIRKFSVSLSDLSEPPSSAAYLTGHFSADFPIDGGPRHYNGAMEKLDTTPPTLSFTLNPATLWPPNDKLDQINATIAVQDDYDPEPEIKLESITATETLGAGDIQDAQLGTDDRSFSLAAKRAGNNQAGRIYTVTYSATDASGNKATASATVTVPHDQGK